jgi:hypothetical protein
MITGTHIILIGFSLVSTYLYGQDFYMYENGQKRTYEISATKMLIKSETPLARISNPCLLLIIYLNKELE